MEIDLKDWPKDPVNGRYLCAPGKPMPKGLPKTLRWSHTSVHQLESTSDYYDSYMCDDCGTIWDEELPE